MKKRTFKIKILLSTAMVCLLMTFFAGPAFADEPELRVTIKGVISNIADVGAHINSQTLLRLYPCDITGQMNVQMDNKGNLLQAPGQEDQKFYLDEFNRLVPPSGLPGIGMPVFDRFNFFKVRGLERGRCYKICVMMMDPPYSGMVSLTTADGSPFEFTLPESVPGEKNDKIVVDLSQQTLLIPEPKKR